MSPRSRARGGPRLVFGITVVIVGVLLTLDNLGIIDSRPLWRLWPLVFIALGINQLSSGCCGSTRLCALIWIFVGTWLLLNELGIVYVSFWEFWPLLLILGGGYLVWQAFAPARAGGVEANAVVNTFAVMSGAKRSSNATDFRGGDVTAVMGGCEIDLRQAKIASGEAVIDALAFWGGIEIRVPEDWAVVNRVFGFLGGSEDKTRTPPAETTQRLIVRGIALMGGVTIKN